MQIALRMDAVDDTMSLPFTFRNPNASSKSIRFWRDIGLAYDLLRAQHDISAGHRVFDTENVEHVQLDLERRTDRVIQRLRAFQPTTQPEQTALLLCFTTHTAAAGEPDARLTDIIAECAQNWLDVTTPDDPRAETMRRLLSLMNADAKFAQERELNPEFQP